MLTFGSERLSRNPGLTRTPRLKSGHSVSLLAAVTRLGTRQALRRCQAFSLFSFFLCPPSSSDYSMDGLWGARKGAECDLAPHHTQEVRHE